MCAMPVYIYNNKINKPQNREGYYDGFEAHDVDSRAVKFYKLKDIIDHDDDVHKTVNT